MARGMSEEHIYEGVVAKNAPLTCPNEFECERCSDFDLETEECHYDENEEEREEFYYRLGW